MRSLSLSGARIVGIACSVPENVSTWESGIKYFGEEQTRKIVLNTGVEKRHISDEKICTSDLCLSSAEKLLGSVQICRESIDSMIFISQTPDYFIPSTSFVIHNKLSLSKSCAVFDVNLGCSGYVYGLWLSYCIIKSGMKNVLLLAGDTISKVVNPEDRSTYMLFGDAGSATLISADDSADDVYFDLGSDGSGVNNLIIPAGGFRKPSNQLTKMVKTDVNGNKRNEEQLFMNGPEVFTFTLNTVPSMINRILQLSKWSMDEVDYFVFHQANKFIIESIQKKMRLPKEKIIVVIDKYGNTSSSSIPLAITNSLSEKLENRKLNIIMAGFGVGYSWGCVGMKMGPIRIPPISTV